MLFSVLILYSRFTNQTNFCTFVPSKITVFIYIQEHYVALMFISKRRRVKLFHKRFQRMILKEFYQFNSGRNYKGKQKLMVGSETYGTVPKVNLQNNKCA